MAVTAYACVNCGGNVRFDIKARAFKCGSCQAMFTLEQMNEAYPDDEAGGWAAVDSGGERPAPARRVANTEESEAKVTIYNCPVCGAELMTDSETLAAASCTFCGKPVSVSERLLSGESLPSRVIPFAVTQDEAFAVFKGKLRYRPLLPKTFTHGIKPSSFKSVYIPFMLYDAECSASMTAKCEKITRWSDSDYDYTKVDTYEARRSGVMAFDQVPADASNKVNDDDMRAVEPFDMENLMPFSIKYLSGHYAEAPTTQESQLMDALYGRLEPAAISTLRDTIWGYNNVTVTSGAMDMESVSSEYVMLPVWMNTVTFKGNDYLFAVNGQTGKFAGKLPFDGVSAFWLFVKLAVVIFILVFIGLEVYLWMS